MEHEQFKKDAYIKAFKKLEDWTFYVNPCNIRTNDKGNTLCVGHPNGSKNNLLCCTNAKEKYICSIFNENCKHHDSKIGCTVQSLSCSLWFCPEAWNNMFNTVDPGIIMSFMQILQDIHQSIRLHSIPARPRHSKEEDFIYANKIFK